MGTVHTKLTGYEDSYQNAVRESGERDIKTTDPKEAAQSAIDLSLHQMD